MSTTHTVPLSVLVRAAAALKVVKDLPVGRPVMGQVWGDVMRSHGELSHHLEKLMAGQEVALSDG